MRKRIIIRVVVLVIGGGIGTVVFRPWESPVEYHKREFLAAREGTFFDHVGKTWNAIIGRRTDFTERRARIELHQTALINLGHLEERTFVVSYGLAHPIAVDLQSWHRGIEEGDLWNVFYTNTNKLIVVAPKSDMPKWEKVVREAEARRLQHFLESQTN